ncbi:hypothetical protein Lp90_1018 [Lactiplantibacillus plantarum]|uniref:Uncharacterized protein n=2 Tax=Lactiplantibacillus plantarum TaxID=1590 RepID=A0AAW3RJR3_LACPN|nr:hypothetical protein [Lactiplantibacillus plantarum]AOB20783.1 hypothetical protein AVR82_14605 [Lactiplantibacillus plantarum]AOB21452.1 hypothetical protein AVR83_00200 [Lactiplantibacillus plantarum]ASZ33117.1 hypothetical protein CLC99_07505 [Lactiplantibacillus plantarum]ERO39706.1 hypothetical protein LPLWJ_31850 [Lactiplantibacillus plantarum WJL]KEZ14834.1 hypothetical protein Lp90_1018 [Lactiplantibacillus plantarum]
MFIRMETNNKAEAIKAWMANHKKLETQGTLADHFNKSITSVNLALNKKMTTDGAERLVNEIYEYLVKKYKI